MNPSFWETNRTILQEQYPGLAELIINETDEPAEDLNIETAASGAPTLAIGGLYVHSPRDPEREGRRLAEACLAHIAEGEEPGPVVILGFGLGYTAEAAAGVMDKQAVQRPIIIVEKRISLLRAAFEQRDLSRFLSRPGIAFIPGGTGEGITSVLALFEKSTAGQGKSGAHYTPHIIRNRTLTSLDEQWYASVDGRIRTWTMRDDVNKATLKKFGKRWIRNLSRSMSAIRDMPGISRLAGMAASENAPNALPVFLAAAGPGLDAITRLLPEIRKRCIIVAVDTSLRFLLRNGIEPDFALVIDPQFWNSCHLFRCENAHTCLIAESAAYPPVLRMPFKRMYLCGSLFPLGAFIEQRVDPKGALGAGGSVATAAWDFSRILGTAAIYTAGLDLAFPGLKTHFKGAQFEERSLSESGRFKPAETWLVHALRDGFPFSAPAISGGQVLTDRRLSLYAAWFEHNFRQFPAVRNYSLSNEGLAIHGLEPAGPEMVLALPERRAEIEQRLEAAFSRIEADFFAPEETRQRGERYQNAVSALVSHLQQINDACEKGEKIIEQAMREHPNQVKQEKTLAALDEINRCITGSEVKDVAGFLLPPELLAEIGNTSHLGSEDTAFRAYLNSSLRFYRSLMNSLPLLAP